MTLICGPLVFGCEIASLCVSDCVLNIKCISACEVVNAVRFAYSRWLLGVPLEACDLC